MNGAPLVQEETRGKTGVRICVNASHSRFLVFGERSIYIVVC